MFFVFCTKWEIDNKRLAEETDESKDDVYNERDWNLFLFVIPL